MRQMTYQPVSVPWDRNLTSGILSIVGLMSGPVVASSSGEHAEPDESRHQQQSMALNQIPDQIVSVMLNPEPTV